VPEPNFDLVETKVWIALHWKMWQGPNRERHLVQVCPPGAAQGSMDLRNRGLDLVFEITYWPKQKRYNLTTGLDDHREFVWVGNLKDREYQAIADRLGVSLNFAAAWVERWRKDAARFARVREAMRKMDAKPVIRKEGTNWRVRGMNRDGTYTSAQRKFRAWEDAVRFVAALKQGVNQKE
jgi:hypothetical protein